MLLEYDSAREISRCSPNHRYILLVTIVVFVGNSILQQ